MSLFESYERRIDQILPVLEKYGIKDLEEAKQICLDKGFDPYDIVKGVHKAGLHKGIRCCKGNRRRASGILHSWKRCR